MFTMRSIDILYDGNFSVNLNLFFFLLFYFKNKEKSKKMFIRLAKPISLKFYGKVALI